MIKNKIHSIALARGLNVSETLKKCDMSAPTYYYCCKTGNFTAYQMRKLSKALDLTNDEIVDIFLLK